MTVEMTDKITKISTEFGVIFSKEEFDTLLWISAAHSRRS